MLSRFEIAKSAEIAALSQLSSQGLMPQPFTETRPAFCASLKTQTIPVIAEYKRASPSKGDINLTIAPETVANAYATAGAGAISVLTEQTYFKGDLSFLARMAAPQLPLLRKDFIYSPLQVEQTASTPASAILLIARCVTDALLRTLIEASLHFGLEPVVEIFDQIDLARAKRANAKIIQVNNRDLNTMKMNNTIAPQLIKHKSPQEFWITASGINNHGQLCSFLDLGFDAALIGSSLMQDDNQNTALTQIIQG